MRGRKKSVGFLGVLLCFCMMLLGGCGGIKIPEQVNVPAVAVSSRGEVTAYFAEEFDKAYYDLSELESMVREEIGRYNAESGSSADVVSVSGEGGKAIVVLSFPETSSYVGYTGMDLFYGTVAGANAAGYDLDVDTVSAKDGTAVAELGLYEMSTKHILIAEGGQRIYPPARAQYVSSNAAINEDGSVDAFDSEDKVYIIMK